MNLRLLDYYRFNFFFFVLFCWGVILQILYPDLYVLSIYEIPTEHLKNLGIKLIVFDIDNTIAPYDVSEPTKKDLLFFEQLKKQGFEICLFSNNDKERVTLFNLNLNATAIHKANKPSTKKLKKILGVFNVSPFETAVVGDQVFTDVLCGNRLGALTILTKPISDKDELITKIKRSTEKRVLKKYFKERNQNA